MPGGTTAAHGPRELGYDAWMAAAAEESRRMTALLDDLPDPLWDRPTDCAGWAVRDVVAHLAGAAAGNASLRESGRQARLARRSDVAGDFVDRVNDVQVSERRGRSPAQLRAELCEASARGVATRRRVPGWLRAVPVPFGPPLGTRPLGYLLGRIYTRDAWMHRVDLSRATGAPLLLTAGHDGRLVEDVVAEWAAAHGRPFDLRLTGEAGGRWARGDGVDLVELDAVEFARTVSGRSAGAGLLAQPVPF